MHESRSARLSNRARALLWVGAASLGTTVLLTACEHAKYWRGAEPYSDEFITRMSDPELARAEIRARLIPATGKQTPEQAQAKSAGCISCHGATDEPDMHADMTLNIGCVDCHGGDATVMSTMSAPGRPGEPGTPITDHEYLEALMRAHVQPRNAQAWYGSERVHYGDHHEDHGAHGGLHGSRNPEVTAALLNQETPEFIRFINPGDLRIAEQTCGACHAEHVANTRHSMMAHGAQLWQAATYNNGGYPSKIAQFGESYSPFGIPQRLQGVIREAKWDEATGQIKTTVTLPTEAEMQRDGVIPFLDPLPRWNIAQPGNMLRVFERGTKLPVPGGPVPNPNPAEPGSPNPLAEGGRPDKGLSPRGLGTLLRTDPVFLGLQKTRLLDPILYMLGTNDHPGDYRSSGCTACHTVYANDRLPAHSGEYASHGHMGFTSTTDPTIPKDQPGHPIRHVFTNAIPNSQCVVCHIHPGTQYANTYLGYMWWDNESDGEFMYPDRSQTPNDEQIWKSLRKNPDDSALRGLWGNLYPTATSHAGENAGLDFLERTGEPREGDGSTLNDRLAHNQFADFHGHGWIFRAVFHKDREGNLLDRDNNIVDPNDPAKWDKAYHLGDVHLEKGMHCIDCHFRQDMHGTGKLYSEVRNAIEVTCIDCHGTYRQYATFKSSGPAAPRNDKGEVVGNDMSRYRVFGKVRFYEEDGKYFQRSAMDPEKVWEIPQTLDTINPESDWAKANPVAAERSRYAKTVKKGLVWGDLPATDAELAHGSDSVECYTCHTSWMTSCFGCHLPMRANERTPMLHNESLYTRNYTRYNFQVLRDDVYMLGRDSTVKGGRVVPVRSSSAVVVSSQNANREWLYSQQQTVSAEGYSGHPMNPHFPHATGGRNTTKMCTDCHISEQNDNNAWMAQLLGYGTNFVNFFGRYVYVAEGHHGLQAVVVTERDEPQAVYGSHLHSLAYPDEHARFVENGRQLHESYHHDGHGALGQLTGAEILDLQHRGEYLYAARGDAGFYVFDIANIDNKGFSERIVTAPVSPFAGQKLGFDTQHAVCVASPSTLAVDPARARISSDPSKPRAGIMDPAQPWHINQEQPVHPIYAYIYIGDSVEGLIMTFAGTLLDGDPANNFLERAELADGSTAFNPDGVLTGLTSLTLAGHIAYATSPSGLAVIDLNNPTDPKLLTVAGSGQLKNPRSVAIQFRYAIVTDDDGLKVLDVTFPDRPALIESATVPIGDAHRVYIARTEAYVAAGANGLAIVDVTNPERPALLQMFNANGQLNDVRDVKVGMVNASLYAFVADGRNGVRVLQLMGPSTTPQFRGFSPPISPELIATYKTGGEALAISKGLDRDRSVDETGHQIMVYGRLGSRPLSLQDMQRMFLNDTGVWKVSDQPSSAPEPFTAAPKKEEEEEDSGRRRRRR